MSDALPRTVVADEERDQVEARLAAHAENTPLAVVEWDACGRVFGWSEAAERMFGWKAEEVVGRPIHEVPAVFDDDAARVFQDLDRLRREEVPRCVSFHRNRRRDGRVVHCAWFHSAVRDAATNVVTVHSQVLDRTREVEAIEALEQANRAKDEFLATVSHELRSPLQGILGWLSLLRRGQLDADQTTRALDAVERSVRHQAQLVHDIMDVSRIVAGNVELDRTPLDLTAMVRATCEEHASAAASRGISLRVHSDPCGNVDADRDRLHQVLSHLLSNAIKFGSQGGSILVSCSRDGDEVAVSVADTGSGIEPEFLPHIFDRFTQADSSSTRRFGGLGLGLAIVRHLVEMHGGSVRAESGGKGQGSTFFVRLPALPEVVEAGDAEAPDTEAATLDGVDILLVEDDDDSLVAMTYALRSTGASVRPAASARDAWTEFCAKPPDLLVSDLSMPEEDGYTLLARIRSLPSGRALPAVALTGFTRPEDRTRVLAAGFAAHVPKPIDPDELTKVLAGILESDVAGHS